MRNLIIVPYEYCYVVPQVGEYHGITDFKDILLYYPERGKSLFKMVNYRPFEKSVITENPFIISCYSRSQVRIWDDTKGWIPPEEQTYGASMENIMFRLLNVQQSIPSIVYDGGKKMSQVENYLKKIYSKSQNYLFEIGQESDKFKRSFNV